MSRGEILVVDDEPDIRRLVQEILEDENYSITTAENAASARDAFAHQRPDLVLLDIWMPDTDGISLLKEWAGAGPLEVPVVMMSGHGNVETAVEATRLGAYDFIEKPVSMGKLLLTVDRALAASRLSNENRRLRDAEPVSVLTGRSAIMQGVRDKIERVAASDVWVLISGEAGSGKAVAARYLHTHSPRADGAFVEVSLAATPPENVMTQLFGHEHGGHVVPGSFEQAKGGTLLLNEIGDLDLDTQAKLMHALEEKRFLRVGGSAPIAFDVRIISSSAQDLDALANSKRFREDLYYHLNVVPIHIPPLREHHEDVPDLITFFVDWLSENKQLPYRRFSTASLNLMRNYRWPGNTRELKNLVQRLLIMNRGPEVSVEEVEEALRPGETGAALELAVPETLFDRPLRDARDLFERAYLEHHLRATGGNVSYVAEISGMERTHLYRKLKQLGVNPKALKEKEGGKGKP